jgi:hypothetical protein
MLASLGHIGGVGKSSAIDSLRQTATLADLSLRPLPTMLSLFEGLQRSIPGLGDLGATCCSILFRTNATSASVRQLKNGGAPRMADATRGSVACLSRKASLLSFIAARCARISDCITTSANLVGGLITRPVSFSHFASWRSTVSLASRRAFDLWVWERCARHRVRSTC